MIKLIIVGEFVLHFLWEYIQLPLFQILFIDVPRIQMAMIAGVADTIAVTLLYLVFKKFGASPKTSLLNSLCFVCFAVGFVVIAELIGTRGGLWAYTESLRVIPVLEVAWLPLAQYAVIAMLFYYAHYKLMSE